MFLWNIGTPGRSKDGGYIFFWMLVSTYQMAWVINQRPQYDWPVLQPLPCCTTQKITSIFTNSLKGCISTKRHFHTHMYCHFLIHLAFTVNSKTYERSCFISIYVTLNVYIHTMCRFTRLFEKMNVTVFQRKIIQQNSINPALTGWDRCHIIGYSELSGTRCTDLSSCR